MKHRFNFFLLMVLVMEVSVSAQQHRLLSENLRTLQVMVNGEWNRTPVLVLGSSDYLDISFDDLTHEYCRYRYRVEHCNYDWTSSDGIFSIDYLSGESSDQPLESYDESLNTSVLYTHYTLRFPNERVGVRLSGNYKLIIFNDDEEKDVCEVCFSVLDNKAMVMASVTTNTDIDINRSHQQVKFKVETGKLAITDAKREIKTLVMQNNRIDNAVWNVAPDYDMGGKLQWEYAKDLIFKAGNEYRKFEMTNMHVPTMNIDNIRYFKPYFHATLYEDKTRPNYFYDQEQNGAFVIRTAEYPDPTVQSDYLLVHFTLQHPFEPNGDIYINGAFQSDVFAPECKMVYNSERKVYEATLLLKQGYYNYQYLYVPSGKEKRGYTANVEGDYYQTENKYSIFVYYRPQGGRYDQLVGLREFRYLPDK